VIRSGNARAVRRAAALAIPAAWALLLGGAPLACRRTIDERPVPALAGTRGAQERMDGIRLRWTSGGPTERAAMRAELSEFVAKLEADEDPLEPLARAYLAIAWLEAGVPAAAEAAARPLVEGAPGVSRDLGQLVSGAAARREGRSAEAIALLSPLVGKMIDGWARPLLDEELTEAYLDEGRYQEAIAAAAAWVRSASGDRGAVLAHVEQVLLRVPAADARAVLQAARSAGGSAGYPPELLAMLERNLDREGDGDLAAADAGADARATADGGFAAGPTNAVDDRFDGRAIALLVPSSALPRSALASQIARVVATFVSPRPTSFDPSAKVATRGDAGVGTRSDARSEARSDAGTDAPVSAPDASLLAALDASPAAPQPTGTAHRLSVFDTAGTAEGMRAAVTLAERDGVATMIGGVTDVEANALAALAQARKIPAILLRRPSTPPTVPAGERPYWISVGPSLADERAATLQIADPYGTADRALVAPWPDGAPAPDPEADDLHVRCDAAPKSATAGAFPVAAWQKRRVAVVVVLGDARCGERVLDELEHVAGYRPRVILSPSALELLHRVSPLARVGAGAGLLPADDDAPADLRALWRELRGPVGWWAGLAHDAAALALAATPGLADADEPTAVARARAATLDKLRAARATLWTSAAAGPDATAAVARTFSARTVGAGGAWTPAWLAD
jgi:hypothetical protein